MKDIFMFRGLKLRANYTAVATSQCKDCFGAYDISVCNELPNCAGSRAQFKPIIDHEPTHDRLAYLLLTNQLNWERTETNIAFEHPATQSPGSSEPRHEGS